MGHWVDRGQERNVESLKTGEILEMFSHFVRNRKRIVQHVVESTKADHGDFELWYLWSFGLLFPGNFHLQLLPRVLLLGGTRYLHALAHRIVVEVDSPRGWDIAAHVKTESLG